MDVNGLLRELIRHHGCIIKRIANRSYKIGQDGNNTNAVVVYDWLQNTYHDMNVDVTECEKYRRTFESYYRINGAGKNDDWRRSFFALLQRRDRSMSFCRVLQHMYDKNKSVEPVFSSKLLATVNPDLPPYDQHVGDSLGIHMPRYKKDRQRQLRDCTRVYCVLREMTSRIVQTDAFSCIRTLFDEAFCRYTHFTDVKKLDFFLWQYDR